MRPGKRDDPLVMDPSFLARAVSLAVLQAARLTGCDRPLITSPTQLGHDLVETRIAGTRDGGVACGVCYQLPPALQPPVATGEQVRVSVPAAERMML